MEMKGSRVIASDRETVWSALLDPDVLKQCIPGCTELAGSPETGFEATVVQKVGPVKATFKGVVSLSKMDRPKSLVMEGEGKGGAAGFAKGGATVHLSDHPDGTEISYDVEAKVGGKLAQLGSRIIDSFARKLADEYFERFQNCVEGTDSDQDNAETIAAAEASPTPKTSGWLGRITGR